MELRVVDRRTPRIVGVAFATLSIHLIGSQSAPVRAVLQHEVFWTVLCSSESKATLIRLHSAYYLELVVVADSPRCLETERFASRSLLPTTHCGRLRVTGGSACTDFRATESGPPPPEGASPLVSNVQIRNDIRRCRRGRPSRCHSSATRRSSPPSSLSCLIRDFTSILLLFPQVMSGARTSAGSLHRGVVRDTHDAMENRLDSNKVTSTMNRGSLRRWAKCSPAHRLSQEENIATCGAGDGHRQRTLP